MLFRSHTENLFRIAEDPTFFFARLDRINSDIEQEVVRRNSIYKEFLTLLINKLEDGAISTVAGKAIIEKAINFQLNESLELHKFRDSFGIDIAIPKLLKAAEPAVFYSQVDVENNEEQPRQIEQLENERLQLLDLTTEQNSKIAELENTKLSIEKLIQENNRIKHELQEKNRLIDHLREEVKALPRLKPSDINAHKLLQRNQKLLVIGGTKVKERDLRGVAKDNSGFKNEDIVFVLEYDKIKSFTSRIVPWNSTYSGIVVGPCPHNTGGSGDYSSFIQKIKEEKGYPHVEEMRESSGQLKMTKQSFREALDRMVKDRKSVV